MTAGDGWFPGAGASAGTRRAVQARVRDRARFDDDDPLPTDPIAAGVDQAFPVEGAVVGAAVSHRGGEWLERTYAVEALETPYIPGYLAFREGPVVVEAVGRLDRTPDVLLVDGNGRLHPRQAGLATHVGVALDLPTVGVAKSLLCGRPRRPLDGLAAGSVVGIEPDDEVDGAVESVLGYALQSRQFAGEGRHVNPIYVSPGHRVSARAAVAIVAGRCTRYKLPDPIRDADRYAARVGRALEAGRVAHPKR